MKAFINILLLILLSNGISGQIDVDAIPSGYTDCPNTIQGIGSCSQFTYLGGTIQMDLGGVNASNNEIEIKFRKCDLTNFTGAGTLYVKKGTDACGSILGQAAVEIDDDISRVTIPYDDWDIGSIDITGVLVSNAGGVTTRYWSGNLVLYKDCEDYSLSNLNVSPSTTIFQGQQNVDFSARVHNNGADDGRDDVRFYLSRDFNIDASDIYLGRESFDLDPGTSIIVTEGHDFDGTEGFGLYRLIAIADEDNGDEECFEDNNIEILNNVNIVAVEISISQPISGYAYAKEIEDMDPIFDADYIPFRWTTQNVSGSINAEIETPTGVSVYNVGNLANNGSYNWYIPQSFNSGSYKLLLYPTGTFGLGFRSGTFIVIDRPSLSGPANGFEFSNAPTSITYSWTKGNPNGIAIYEIRIRDLTSGQVLKDYDNVGDVASYVHTYNYISGHQYSWVVRAKAGINNETMESAPYEFTIQSAGSPDLKLQSAISIIPSSPVQNGPLTINATVINDGNAIWSGDLELRIYNNSNVDSDLDQDFGVTIPENGTRTLSFTTSSVGSVPGDYFVVVRSKENGSSWIDTPDGGYENPVEITIQSPAPLLSITSPNGGESFASGQTILISWNHSPPNSNISIELIDHLGTPIDVIVDNVSSTGTYSYDTPGCLPSGSYKMKIYETANTSVVDLSDNNFTITNTNNCPCTITNPPIGDDPELVAAVHELCSRGIINEGDTRPNEFITRAELAKIVFIALFENTDAKPSDYFPSPFLDLQNELNWYYRYVKALTYLDYDDGVSPFERHFAHFRPEDQINRQHVVKAILEAFDVSEDCIIPNSFDDVTVSTDGYCHIVSAADLGIINSTGSFRPTEFATREEVFLITYRLLLLIDQSIVVRPTLELSDYYCPGNFSVANLSRGIGIGEGNFNSYSKTSFAMPAIGLPLVFAHEYNSYLTNLPDELFSQRPLGHGWTHSYHSYIMKYLVYDEDLGSVEKYFIVWPSGQMEVYKNSGSGYPRNLDSETKGVYDDFTLQSSSTILIKDKGQTSYKFEKKPNGDGVEVFFLTQITDRLNHSIFVEYEAGHESRQRINKVYRDLGNSKNPDRSLLFDYNSGTNHLNHVYLQNPAIRAGAEIWFDVNGESDLKEHTDRRHRQTFYKYAKDVHENESDEFYKKREHLLYRIQLPKGNVINNSYEKRRLNSTKSSENNIVTNIEVTPNWDDVNPSFNSVITQIGDSENEIIHQTSIEYDTETGAPKQVSRDGDIVNVQFGQQEAHPYIPTKVTDGLFDVEYSNIDPKGNIGQFKYTLRDANPATVYQHQFIFDTYNNLTHYTDPSNNNVVYDYGSKSAEGLLASVTDQEGNSASYDYYTTSDAQHLNGGLKTAHSALGFQIPLVYDDYGNLTKITAPGNRVAQTTYDEWGRINIYTNPIGHHWDYDHYDNDLLSRVTNPRGDPIKYDFDPNDNLTAVTNEKLQPTNITYDQETDQLTSQTFGPNTTSFEYHNSGYLKSFTKPDQTKIDMSYIPSGNGVGQVSDDGYATFTYDNEHRVKTISKLNSNGNHILTYHYDVKDRITSYDYEVVGAYSYSVAYEFDVNGNISKLLYPNLQGTGTLPVQYNYYKNNWLKSVEDWEGKKTSYYYRSDGSMDYCTLPNGTSCHYEYDASNNDLIKLYYKRSDESLIVEYDIIRDDLGRIDELTKNEPMGLVGEGPYSHSGNFTDYNFSQDYAGNSIAINPNGNQESDGENSYTWDNYDMLTSVNTTGKVYRYDGLGMRRESLDNGTLNRYIYDISGMGNVIAEWAQDGSVIYYIHGAGLHYRKVQNGNAYDDATYHYNLQGSTVAISNEAQNLTHRYQYDTWGKMTWSDETDDNPFTFVGQYGVMQESPSLYWMRARYYDAEQGRFLSQDPLWSTNLFAYAGGDPVNLVDPEGTAYVSPDLEYMFDQSFEIFEGAINKIYYSGKEALDFIILDDINQCIEDPGITMSCAMTATTLVPMAKFIKVGKVGISASGNFFKGANYSKKVLSQLKNIDDAYHAFPIQIDELVGKFGQTFYRTGGDGKLYKWLQMDGSINGKSGIFEYIKDDFGEIIHRLFREYKN